MGASPKNMEDDLITIMPQSCASCAAPCGGGVRCSKCKSLYCDAVCQKKHWKKGGHKHTCEEIALIGVEEHWAKTKAEEAAAAAVASCATECGGQRCSICLTDGPGLVRGCCCRGTSGYAHLTCMVSQARAASEDGGDAAQSRCRLRWLTCGLCKQSYQDVVLLAMAREFWRSSRRRGRTTRRFALQTLGFALDQCGFEAEALHVREKAVEVARGLGLSELLVPLSDLAQSLAGACRYDEALALRQQVYGIATLESVTNAIPADVVVEAAVELASSLESNGRFDEARKLLRDWLPRATATLGCRHLATMSCRMRLGHLEGRRADSTLEATLEGEMLMKEAAFHSKQVCGSDHPITQQYQKLIGETRAA